MLCILVISNNLRRLLARLKQMAMMKYTVLEQVKEEKALTVAYEQSLHTSATKKFLTEL